MSNPSVIFVSACDLIPDTVIEKVLNCPLGSGKTVFENITAYQWHIDNKYYTANVDLCSVKSKAISNAEFADTVEAVVICFDGSSDNGLLLVNSWLPFLTVYDAEIKILVCQRCSDGTDEDLLRKSVLEWCIEKGFELVELDPNLEDFDVEDDFPETLGVERIRQALNAHQWFNLELKNNECNSRILPIENSSNDDHSSILVESLEDLLVGDSFGDLFVQLADIKERVSGLSGNERKDAAEQVVRALWNAMGNDDDDL